MTADQTVLVIARHGESVCNVSGTAGGEQGCTGLTVAGRHQAGLLAARLARGERFAVVYSSPRRRAQETGQILARAVGLPLITEMGLDGPRPGAADGRRWAEVHEEFGGLPETDPARPFADGAESWTGFLDRCGAALQELIARHRGDRVLVSGHAETVEAAATTLLRLPAGTCTQVRWAAGYTSLTSWLIETGHRGRETVTLEYLNDTRHLDGGPAGDGEAAS